jgi:pimeloyl-ACP methyl ester carboxylesterase
MSQSLPLILLSGMGADHRLLQRATAGLGDVRAARWIEPTPGESLREYAWRMAAAVDPGEPCLVGGVSLGGMIAVEMAAHLQARAVVLISSIRSPDELPRRWRVFRRVARWLPPFCFGVPQFFVAGFYRLAGRRIGPIWRELLEQYLQTDWRFLRWSTLALLSWTPPEPPSVPIVQIHGDRDFMLPHRLTRPDVVVEGIGHLLIVQRADAVGEFLKRQMERFFREAGTGMRLDTLSDDRIIS